MEEKLRITQPQQHTHKDRNLLTEVAAYWDILGHTEVAAYWEKIKGKKMKERRLTTAKTLNSRLLKLKFSR